MSREGASAPYWRYRSGSEKLTMSTSRTARRPTSVAPAIAIAALRFARFGLGKAAFAFLALTTTYLIKLNLLEREEGAAKAEKLEGRFSDKDEKRET